MPLLGLSLLLFALPQWLKDEFVFVHDLSLPCRLPSCSTFSLPRQAKRLNITPSRESLHISSTIFFSLSTHIQHELPYHRFRLTGVMVLFFLYVIDFYVFYMVAPRTERNPERKRIGGMHQTSLIYRYWLLFYLPHLFYCVQECMEMETVFGSLHKIATGG